MNQLKFHDCKSCELHQKAYTVCMPGAGNPFANLQLWVDYPNEEADKRHKPDVSRPMTFLIWMLERMSIDIEQVYIGYTIRCAPPKALKGKENILEKVDACQQWRDHTAAKAVVAMGEATCYAFFGRRQAEVIDTYFKDKTFDAWVYAAYGPGACMADPSLSVGTSRTIWTAALKAGLQPKIDKTKLQTFDYEIM